MNQNKNRRDKNFIPSDASPRSGREGCLCKNGKTYSTECCDGSVGAQGIGNTKGNPYFEPTIETGLSFTPPSLGYDSLSSPSIGSIDNNAWGDKRLVSVMYIVSNKTLKIEFEGNQMNAFSSFTFGVSPYPEFPPLLYVKRSDFESEYDSVRDVTVFSYYVGYTFFQISVRYDLKFIK